MLALPAAADPISSTLPTGSVAAPEIQNPPPWPTGMSRKISPQRVPKLARSACETHREWIEATPAQRRGDLRGGHARIYAALQQREALFAAGCDGRSQSNLTAPTLIGSDVILRIFERDLEIRDIATLVLLRRRHRSECPDHAPAVVQ